MGSMFADAKVINTPKSGKGKANATPVREIVGLRDLAGVVALIKSLAAVKSTLESQVKTSADTIFVADALNTGKRPENFEAVEDDATASVQLKKRASNSKLNDAEIEQLTNLDVPLDTVVETHETFVINPAYATDAVLLAKVEKALKGVKGLPVDFIQKQKEVSSVVISDATIDHICKDKALVQSCLMTATTIAVAPKLEVKDMKKLALDIVSRYLVA